MVLRESFPPGYVYRVSCRLEGSGVMQLPPGQGEKEGRTLKLTGASVIDYDERVLDSYRAGEVTKTLRVYREIDFNRKIGADVQRSTIRPQVRQMVLLRRGPVEIPFSLHGPMTWQELDLIRTDVFTPALLGMLPEKGVRVGDRWSATSAATRELTDMEKIDDGTIECRLEQTTQVVGRPHARIAFKGAVKGVDEDGPNRQELDGYLLFDLESKHISYLSFLAQKSLLDPDGTARGKIDGRFVLTRQAGVSVPELSESAVAGRRFEPNDDNTQLLYDNADLGIRLLYPRRWHVGKVQGRQIWIDEAAGNGLILTLETPEKTPTAAQLFAATRQDLPKQKMKILREEQPRRVPDSARELEHFSMLAEAGSKQYVMDFYVLRQAAGGAVLSARLSPRDQASLERQVGAIARSIVIEKVK